MRTEAQRKASTKFNKLHTTMLSVRLHNTNDKDILDYLNEKENKQAYIKELIRKDMGK